MNQGKVLVVFVWTNERDGKVVKDHVLRTVEECKGYNEDTAVVAAETVPEGEAAIRSLKAAGTGTLVLFTHNPARGRMLERACDEAEVTHRTIQFNWG